MQDEPTIHPPAHISIFDVDRTITRIPTYSAFLLFACLRLKPWRLLLLPVLVPCALAYATGLIKRARMKAIMHWVALGPRLARHRAEQIAEQFAARLAKTGIYHQALSRIRIERSAGRRIILATAAPELYIRPLANRLGIADIVATRCHWTGDTLCARIKGENCYGQAKRRMITSHFAECGIARDQVHVRAFTDHDSDLPMLAWADEAVAVNASTRLRRIASDMGWPILNWKAGEQAHRRGAIDARRLPA